MAPKSISENEWVAELERVFKRSGDDGLSASEIASSIGKSVDYTRQLLKKLNALGRLVVGRRPVVAIDGRQTSCPVYRIKPEKKA